ncbi:Ribosomal protein S6 kinase alpha-5, partial [Phlyctochytrium bullatum]
RILKRARAQAPAPEPSHAEPEPNLILDSEDDELADAKLDFDERRARYAVRLAVRNGKFSESFTLEAVLGFGSYGVAVLARPKVPIPDWGMRPVVVKLAYKWKYMTTEPPMLDRDFRSTGPEVEMLQLANKNSGHPNILKFLKTWEDAFHTYIVTELVGSGRSGEITGTLSFTLNEAKDRVSVPVYRGSSDMDGWINTVSNSDDRDTILPPLPMARGMFAQAACGLAFLHENGMFHGDIKEDNMFVDSVDVERAVAVDRELEARPAISSTEMADLAAQHSPRVVIADLGMAKHGDPKPKLVSYYGCQAYFPPELHPNLRRSKLTLKTVDPLKADIFALGLSLYTLLHGADLFPAAATAINDGNPTAVRDEQERLKLNPRGFAYPIDYIRDDLDPEGERLLRSMLCTNPRLRPSMKTVLESPWVQEVLDAAARRSAAGEE